MDRPIVPNDRRPTAGELKSIMEWFLADGKLCADDTVVCVLNRTEDSSGGPSCWTEIVLRRRDRPFPVLSADGEGSSGAEELDEILKSARTEATPKFIVDALAEMPQDEDAGEALGHPLMAPYVNKLLELGVDKAEHYVHLMFFPGCEGAADVSDFVPNGGLVFRAREDGGYEEVTDPVKKAELVAAWKGA